MTPKQKSLVHCRMAENQGPLWVGFLLAPVFTVGFVLLVAWWFTTVVEGRPNPPNDCEASESKCEKRDLVVRRLKYIADASPFRKQ